MRYIRTTFLLCLIVVFGCTDESGRSNSIKHFIPGTYVKEVRSKFVIASDTLIIQRTSGDNYLIVNRTAYRRIQGNRLSAQQYSEMAFGAVFNNESQNLYEQRLGKTFSFDPANGRLFEGGSQYTKVNP